MKEFWNNRYQNKEYAYGESPNLYFQAQLSGLTPGKILLPAEGEGRNAVFAASKGWEVTAFDISEAGKEKAEQLALKNGVQIKYLTGDAEDLEFEEGSFDVIALIFAHFPEPNRKRIHQQLSKYLKPGGHIIIEAFSKKHLAHNLINEKAGGPKDESMLYTADMIRSDFPGCQILELTETDTVLQEGNYHQGQASVVRFLGKKNVFAG